MATVGNPHGLGDLESAVLELLWERGPLTTPFVHDAIGKPRGLAYTTILTVLQRLTAKGMLRRAAEGKGHRYEAVENRETFARRRATDLAAQVVQLGPAGMVAFLAEAERLDPDTVEHLRQRLDRSQL